MTQILLIHKANPNIPTPSGYTLLHSAVSSNKMSLASLLLNHGAELNALDAKGNTPLDIARKKRAKQKSYQKIEHLLLAKGAKSSKQCMQSFAQ